MQSGRGEGSVSIVVPTFNRLDYLRPALDSVFAQTWTDWDLIIADDGSGEALRAYLRQFDHRPRVKVLSLAHTGIPAAVRNAGVREATGAYVAFLDSDDLWAPRKLELQIAAMRARPSCQWSYTAFRRVDRHGKVLAEERYRPWHPHEGAIFGQLVTGRASVRRPACSWHVTCCWRSAASTSRSVPVRTTTCGCGSPYAARSRSSTNRWSRCDFTIAITPSTGQPLFTAASDRS